MFQLASPYILLFLPLPYLVMFLLPRHTTSFCTPLKVPFYNNLKKLISTSHKKTVLAINHRVLAWLTWILLVLSAAGPQWVGPPIALEREGRDLLLAIDISGSMEIADMRIGNQTMSRLDIVKKTAGRFIEDRAGDKLGLILFGTKAYLQTPLTFDHHAVKYMLNDASIGLAGKQTAIGDAIGLAIKRLKKYPQKSRVLILLTDGANNAGAVKPLEAAKLAANNNIRIYTIGLAAESMVVRGFFGTQVVDPSTELDEATLEKIAQITGGLYMRAKDAEGLEKIYQKLDRLESTTDKSVLFRPKKPLYYWPAIISLLISSIITLPYIRIRGKKL